MTFNKELAENATFEDFEKLGFVTEDDGTDDPRGVDYNYRHGDFHIFIDAWFCVNMGYRSSDFIRIKIDDLPELESLIDFIKS